MLNWIEPKYSKTQVKKAGKRIRNDEYCVEDISIVENWRASHAYILNTFQANLRLRSRDKNITVAQRLKRRHTIFDKLKREPCMQLSTMHDIAGCRVIFEDQKSLYEFRESLHKARFKHVLVSSYNGKYDYISHPKPSGYRGVHDVYQYNVSSKNGVRWNGLLIEIQYRTKYQHAWATAVEVADIITTNRIKFSDTDNYHKQFFQLASEIIARSYENQNSCFPEMENLYLVQKFEALDKKLGLMRTFSNLQKTSSNMSFKKNTLLIFKTATYKEKANLNILTFDSVNAAIEKYDELEKKMGDSADIVLVRGENEETIRDAFRNYFSDTYDFVNYIREGCALLAHLNLPAA